MSSLEKHPGGTAKQVKSPEFIVGRLSESRREVDVSLRTKLGSSKVLVIVECRDRDNTQAVTWVEQLAGKREDVGLDKAVAVSAIGFTEGTRNMAAAKGIPLRTMRQIDLSAVLLRFPFQEMVQDGLAWEWHDVSIAGDPSAESMSSVTETNFDVPFRSKRDGTWALLWQHLWNDLLGRDCMKTFPRTEQGCDA